MPQRTIHRIFTIFALALATGSIAFAQSSTAPGTFVTPPRSTWEIALGSSKGTLFVVTKDQPHRRQTCHIQSFTATEFACSRAIGGPRTYLRQQVVALILPGDEHLIASKVLLVLGFSGLGGAIWGTVVLAATCPACAAAAGIATFFWAGAAWLSRNEEKQRDRLLYLAPGQKLTGKLSAIQF
jgi:hypothetical protein